MKAEEKRTSMNWFYFACNRCNTPFCTTIDNPDFHVKCAICGFEIFHSISKKEYETARQESNR